MSSEVVRATVDRIAEHAQAHGLSKIRVIFHGGEPLLAGVDSVVKATSLLRSRLSHTHLEAVVQTNGVLLGKSQLDALVAHGLRVGVSIDGGAEANRRRIHRDGSPSHPAVRRSLELLSAQPYRASFAGVIAVVDLAADPVATYEELLSFDPPAMDVLLPHANWSVPPPHHRHGDTRSTTPYADWLRAMFNRWFDAPRQETAFRLFQEILNLLLGGTSGREGLGLAPSTVVVIETDGAIEAVDALKSAYAGAASTGGDVRTHSLDSVLNHPTLVAQQLGISALADQCVGCRVRDVCGGGFYPHRYRKGVGFRNPSVYCGDLLELIGHVRRRLSAAIIRDQAASPTGTVSESSP